MAQLCQLGLYRSGTVESDALVLMRVVEVMHAMNRNLGRQFRQALPCWVTVAALLTREAGIRRRSASGILGQGNRRYG